MCKVVFSFYDVLVTVAVVVAKPPCFYVSLCWPLTVEV